MTTGEGAGLGHRVVQVRAGTDSGRLRTSSTDVLIAVLSGGIEVIRGRDLAQVLRPGQVARMTRDAPWSVRALHHPTRLLVVASPAGPERVVAALCGEPPLPPHRRLALALEMGVELVL